VLLEYALPQRGARGQTRSKRRVDWAAAEAAENVTSKAGQQEKYLDRRSEEGCDRLTAERSPQRWKWQVICQACRDIGVFPGMRSFGSGHLALGALDGGDARFDCEVSLCLVSTVGGCVRGNSHLFWTDVLLISTGSRGCAQHVCHVPGIPWGLTAQTLADMPSRRLGSQNPNQVLTTRAYTRPQLRLHFELILELSSPDPDT